MLFTVFMISLLVTGSVGNVKANHQEGDKGKKIVKRATNCYDDLGCFSNSPPYDNTLIDSVPQSPTEIGTSFLLYTRNNPTNEEVIVAGAVPSNFQRDSNTVFIIHGWNDHGRNWWIKAMTSALLTKASLNVIAVDWEKGSDNLVYDQSAADIRVVGAQVAQLIGFLNTETGTTNSRYHIIGHSLGAHAAGYAGERLQGLRRISGLDPAGLYFEKKDELVRLDPSDATFVDVIHTDGGTLLSLSLGLEKAIGDVDFYPNGGHDQPGCNSISQPIYCSHNRALHLYIESINSECLFTAYPCSSENQWESLQCESKCGTGCSVMGYNVDPNTIPGKYYLYTGSSSPFCGYLYRFNMLLSGEQRYSYGDVLVTLHGTKGDSTPLKQESETYYKNEKLSIRGFLPADIGEVTRITITFKKGSGVLAWFSSSKLRVGGIEVVDKFGQRKGKCFGSVTLKDEEAQSFDISLSTSLAAC